MWNVVAKIVLIKIRKKTMIINNDIHISGSNLKVISDLSSNKSHIITTFILQDKLLHYICRTIALFLPKQSIIYNKLNQCELKKSIIQNNSTLLL